MIKSINDICAKLVKSRHNHDESINESSSEGTASMTTTPAPVVIAKSQSDTMLAKHVPPIQDIVSSSSDDDDSSLKSWSDGQMNKLFRTSAAVPAMTGAPQPPPPPTLAPRAPPIQLNTRTKPPSLPNTYNVDRSHMLRAPHDSARTGIVDTTTVRRVSGFMRFLTHDDCAVSCVPAATATTTAQCAHRLRRAHYHCMHVSMCVRARTCACLQANCRRVYLLASEAHIHYNMHCKVEQLARDGFARFKSTETCPYARCVFRAAAVATAASVRTSISSQRTTHFHCIRNGCDYAFRAKADMGERVRARPESH